MAMKRLYSGKVVAGFFGIAFLLVLAGYFSSVATKNIQRISRAIMKENVSSLKAAEELELALLSQKGLVSNYFLDGSSSWLRDLEEKKKDFQIWFTRAQEVALTDKEKNILTDISFLYETYNNQRNNAIRLFMAGSNSEARKMLLHDIKISLDNLYYKCEELILANEALIEKAEVVSQKEAENAITFVWGIVLTVLSIGIFTGFFISRKAGEQLARSAKMASLGTLSATVAHEIRNPLTSIKMRLYSLSEETAHTTTAKDDVSVISEEIGRMEKIVQEFLNFARPPEPNFQKCDINSILAGTVQLISPKAEALNIKIKESLYPSPLMVFADKEQLRQAFLNVMLNAMDAMPSGGAMEIYLNAAKHIKYKHAAEVRIQDTGVGIAAEAKAKLFEPFFTTKAEGTGLGLFITSRILTKHKGSIHVESRLDKGSTFIMILPLARGL